MILNTTMGGTCEAGTSYHSTVYDFTHIAHRVVCVNSRWLMCIYISLVLATCLFVFSVLICGILWSLYANILFWFQIYRYLIMLFTRLWCVFFVFWGFFLKKKRWNFIENNYINIKLKRGGVSNSMPQVLDCQFYCATELKKRIFK